MEIYTTTFETYERKIRDLLARTIGAGGFDPAQDIVAHQVNRWPHGYAYTYNSLFEPWTGFIRRPMRGPAWRRANRTA